MESRKIIISDSYELWKTLYKDCGEVITYPYNDFRKGTIGYFIYRVTHDRKLKQPFLNQWNKWVISKWGRNFDENDIIIMLNPAIWSWYMHLDMIKELKQKKVKLVLLMVDSMKTMRKKFSKKIIEYTSYFDLIYTFDKEDAKTYGWKHSYSYYFKPQNSVGGMEKKIDVLCILYNSGRLEKITRIWDILQKKKVRCFFAINGVNDLELKKYFREGIIYNKQYSYEEILKYVNETNVILEIIQDNQSGCTLRTYEATVYGKRLITNNSDVINFPFFNDEYMKYCATVNDIEALDRTFFTNQQNAKYDYNDELSIEHLYEEIDDYLKNRIIS